MDPKPFRCAYDPELSKSRSKGSKPIYIRISPDQVVQDPRLGKTRVQGKRAPPSSKLPLPDFARDHVREPPPVRRCLLTGIGPLVTKSKFQDIMGQFGDVEDCQIVISQTTGASLGIAWVLFASKDTRAASSLVESNQQGLLSLETDGRRLDAKLDPDGTLLTQAEQSAERAAQREIEAQFSRPKNGEVAVRDDDLRRVELRNLSTNQVTLWFNKYLGSEPCYVMIRDIFLSVKQYSLQDMERMFSKFAYSHIAINKTGFYICFKKPEPTLECYFKMHRHPVHGVPIKLLVTLDGRRYRHEELVALWRKRETDRETRNGLNGHSSSVLPNNKTLRPGERAPATIYDDAAKSIVDELGPQLKRATWQHCISQFVESIVERELAKFRETHQQPMSSQPNQGEQATEGQSPATTSTDIDLNSSTLESKESTPAGIVGPDGQSNREDIQQAVGFGARRGGAIGMTARAVHGYGVVRPWSHLPGLKIRKRQHEDAAVSALPQMKKRKALQVTASAPNSYVRAPIKPANGVKAEGPSVLGEHSGDLSMEVDNDDDNEGEEDEDVSAEEEDQDYDEYEVKPAIAKSSRKPVKSNRQLANEHAMGVEEVEEVKDEEDEESDDETRGMDIEAFEQAAEPLTSNPDDFDYKSIQRLVKSKEDFEVLQSLVSALPTPEISDEDVYTKFLEDFAPKLRPEAVNWPLPQQTQSFRLSPYRHRPDDERRLYLTNLGPGIPNEIVQSYKDRPLYEGFEDVEEEESRTDSRALNVSRSAFGVNSDLFADDNLSKNAKDTRLARSAIHDWGLYANEAIPENDFVIEYVGDVLRDEYAEIRERHYALEGIDSTYLFRLDNGTVIDATKRGNGARFINHSCNPNCTAQVFDYEGFKRVVLFSLRDIEPDEELTFDYNFVKSQDEDGRVRCACGAENCRGWLM